MSRDPEVIKQKLMEVFGPDAFVTFSTQDFMGNMLIVKGVVVRSRIVPTVRAPTESRETSSA